MRTALSRRRGGPIAPARIGAAVIAVIAVLALAALAGGAARAAAATPAAAGAATPHGVAVPAPGSIVVVRRIAGRDSLWSVDPASKAATQLVGLPFRPARVEGSPGAVRIAYLPSTAGPRVYVYDTRTGVLHAWSLAARGVKVVDSLAWISSTTLVVAGKATRGYALYPFADRLYKVNAATGAVTSFGSLLGTEPTAAPGVALAWVRLSDGGPIAGAAPARWVVERLYRLGRGAGAPFRLIASAKYPDAFDIRAFHDPRLSRDGAHVITSTTGSDVSVRYSVRSAATGKVLRTVDTTLAGRDATAWKHVGDQVAFWGMPSSDPATNARLAIYDVATQTLRGSATLSRVAVTGLAWSADDTVLAYSLRGLQAADDNAELWTTDPVTFGAQTNLGAGSFPVFMPGA
jgi:hypothetical protein